MSTSVQQLREWFDRGIEQQAAYMVVVCDTFDWGDYPVFCKTKDDAQRKIDDPGSMQKVMEVYDLTASKDEQLCGGTRVWALTPARQRNEGE